MALGKELALTIKIAGKMDKSLTAAISATNGQISSLSRTFSTVGTVGLAAMGALATGTAFAIRDCTKEAERFEQNMSDVVKYVDGLADATGRISDNIWSASEGGNGKTFAQNYQEMSKAILDLSTQIPMTAQQITELAAAAGQSGKSINDLIQYDANGNIAGFLKDVAMVGTAMDISAEQAGDWAAKWEKSLDMTHSEVMVLFDQINYLGANSATTAAEIAEVVNGAASLGEIAGMDAASTAALADAMLAMGVEPSVASTSISRMLVNMSKGESATKAQQAAWEELGFTASGVAKSMQDDAAGTLLTVLDSIGGMDADRQVATLNTLFGQWAIKGAAKLTGNLEVYEEALRMVSDPNLYTGSMEREFIIKAGTSESIDMMMGNAFDALKIDFGTAFLPAKKEFSLMLTDVFNGLRDNMPALSKLAESGAQLLSNGVEAAGGALQAAMPYIQQALDYLLNNGDKAIKIVEGLAAAFLGMKFAPQIEGLARGVGSFLTGGGGQGANGKMGGLFGGIGKLFTGGQQFAGKAGAWLSGVPGMLGTAKEFIGTAAVDAKLNGTGNVLTGLLGQALGQTKVGSALGGYFGGIGNAFGNLANTKIGSSILGGAKATGGVAMEILSGISEATGLTDLWNGAKGLAQSGAGWLAGKGKNALAAITQSAPAQAIGGFAGKAASGLGGLLAPVGQFMGAGGGVLSSIWGPIAGGFGSLLAGAAPVVAAISGIIAIVSILGDHLTDIRDIIGNVFGDTGLAVFDSFTEKIESVKNFVFGLFQDGGVANALAPLREGFANLLDGGGMLSTLFGGQETGLAAFDGVVGILQSVMGVIGQLVDFSVNTVKPIIQEVFGFIVQNVIPTIVSTFAAAAPSIAGIISGIGSAIMTGMQIIGTAIQLVLPVIEWLVQALMNVGSVVIPAVLAYFSVFAEGIASVIASIQGIFDGLITFITGVFTGNWSQAWDGIKQIFGSAFDALIELCKVPINAVIALINSAISGINGLGLTIPEWVPVIGGKSFSINIPEIPMLAKGGFTNGPSIAGEAGREAVISFQSGVRASNIATWMQAGRMLGVDNIEAAHAAGTSLDFVPMADNRVELEDVGGGAPGGDNITYAPQIIVQGNAGADTVEQIKQLLAEERARFEAWYEERRRREARTAY